MIDDIDDDYSKDRELLKESVKEYKENLNVSINDYNAFIELKNNPNFIHLITNGLFTDVANNLIEELALDDKRAKKDLRAIGYLKLYFKEIETNGLEALRNIEQLKETNDGR